MKVAAHLEKVARFESLRLRLDKERDFELWYWVLMNSGTNALNAALHSAGVTVATDGFPVQPGVYLEPSFPPGTLVAKLGPLGDVIHADRPRIDASLPEEVRDIVRAMETLESYRDPCIRFGREATADVVAACEAAYLQCLSLARQVVASGESHHAN
jgi:hypothetical protein